MIFPLRKSLFVAIVLAMLALLALSACGGGDDDDDGGDNGGNDPTATATEDSGDDGDDGDDDGEDSTEDAVDDDDGDDGDDGGDGGDDDDGGELGALACSLLTPEDIESVTGITMGEGEPSSIAAGFGDCRWENDIFNSISTSVVTGQGAETLFELDLGNSEIQDLDGLGDRAHYLPGFLPFVEFLQDGVYVSVSVATDEDDEDVTKDQAIELGHIASDNLP